MGVIKIGSKTCGPCILAEKKLNNMGIEHTSLDAHTDDIDMYNVRNIPTIIKTDDGGNELFRLCGGECLNVEKLNTLK